MINHLPMKWMLVILTNLTSITLLTSHLYKQGHATMLDWNMVNMNSMQLNMVLMLDSISIPMLIVVLMVSCNVLMFSNMYMQDLSNPRFYIILITFIMSMLIFSMSPNLMSMMLGWDGLGITSFLLVSYYQTPAAAGSSMITMFTNRLGDAFILMSMAMMSFKGYWTLTSPLPMTISIMIIIAAMTKSAHFPFHLWLPEAMAAPTPVSALVHSSTLVTAGIILTLRLYKTVKHTPLITNTLFIMGVTTTALASTNAIMSEDPKKTIALSTMSQLGMMTMSIGSHLPEMAILHLITHAMFKASMFICQGIIMLIKSHSQNLKSIKSKNQFNLLSYAYFISLISLNAFPFTAGFYSKDLMLESMFFQQHQYLLWASINMKVMTLTMTTIKYFIFFMLFSVSMMMTTIYSMRLWKGSIFSMQKTQSKSNNNNLMSPLIILPMTFMPLMSLIMGSQASWISVSHSYLSILTTTSNMFIYLTPITGWMIMSNSLQVLMKPMRTNNSNLLLLPAYIKMNLKHQTQQFMGSWYMNNSATKKTFTTSINLYKTLDKSLTLLPSHFLHLSSSAMSKLYSSFYIKLFSHIFIIIFMLLPLLLMINP